MQRMQTLAALRKFGKSAALRTFAALRANDAFANAVCFGERHRAGFGGLVATRLIRLSGHTRCQ